jgi:ribosomal protein S18 acetylase RimI-like enzyme
MTAAVSLRPAGPGDQPFLHALYARTRADELAAVPWSQEQLVAFLTMQFEAQDRSYREAYPTGRFLVIERTGEPIGRLSLGRHPGELRIIEIALLPEHRNTGIGSSLVRDVLAEADAEDLAVTLHVERWNPAQGLYRRMGFAVTSETDVHLFMRRPAGGPAVS